MAGANPIPRALVRRIYARCVRRAGHWIWTGALGGNRRPAVRWGAKVYYAARIVLVWKLGRYLRPGKVAAHTCDHPRCLKPSHLEEASYRKNLKDAWVRGRRPRTLRG